MDAERQGFPHGRGVVSPDLEGLSAAMQYGARHILDRPRFGKLATAVQFGVLAGPRSLAVYLRECLGDGKRREVRCPFVASVVFVAGRFLPHRRRYGEFCRIGRFCRRGIVGEGRAQRAGLFRLLLRFILLNDLQVATHRTLLFYCFGVRH